jgi:mRNA interferase YafQ
VRESRPLHVTYVLNRNNVPFLQRVLRRGKKEEKIISVMKNLINQEPLEVKHKDHNPTGEYKNRRECHIEPDWLLIYKISGDEIIFERTGSHADLFR